MEIIGYSGNSVNTLLHILMQWCIQVQPSFICNVSHNPSCTCMILHAAQSRFLKPRVRLSSFVRTDDLLSSSNPNLLAKAVQELLAVTGPIHVLPSKLLSLHVGPELLCCCLYMLFQSCPGRWDLLHIGLLCKEFLLGLVYVFACAGPVIQQDGKPFSGMHSPMPNKAGHSVTTGEGMEHWKCLGLYWSKPNGYSVSCQVSETFARPKC